MIDHFLRDASGVFPARFWSTVVVLDCCQGDFLLFLSFDAFMIFFVAST